MSVAALIATLATGAAIDVVGQQETYVGRSSQLVYGLLPRYDPTVAKNAGDSLTLTAELRILFLEMVQHVRLDLCRQLECLHRRATG